MGKSVRISEQKPHQALGETRFVRDSVPRAISLPSKFRGVVSFPRRITRLRSQFPSRAIFMQAFAEVEKRYGGVARYTGQQDTVRDVLEADFWSRVVLSTSIWNP